jgi:hypothetical protein
MPAARVQAHTTVESWRSTKVRACASSAATLLLTTVAAASLVAPGCAHHDEHDVVLQRRLQEGRSGPAPPAHNCAALPVDSPLRALESKEILDGCPGTVQLRPGTYVEADVLFTCSASPDPMIILRGHGQTPLRVPADTDRRRFAYRLVEVARGLVHDVALYGAGVAPAPTCTASERGLMMSVSDYDDVDVVVEQLRRWIHANDLDIEVVILLVPPSERPPMRLQSAPPTRPARAAAPLTPADRSESATLLS